MYNSFAALPRGVYAPVLHAGVMGARIVIVAFIRVDACQAHSALTAAVCAIAT